MIPHTCESNLYNKKNIIYNARLASQNKVKHYGENLN